MKKKDKFNERALSSRTDRILTSNPKFPDYARALGRGANRHIPSIPYTGPVKPSEPKEKVKYTGTAIIGIGTMHKSNAVPVSSKEQAEELAKMRRS